jgi:hypothetical protein
MTTDELDAIEARAKDAWAEVRYSDRGARDALPSDYVASVIADAGALVVEVRRLRKLFDDAGQGEHNVLALVEHYQQAAIDADARVRMIVNAIDSVMGKRP